jgi:hypothetical protein
MRGKNQTIFIDILGKSLKIIELSAVTCGGAEPPTSHREARATIKTLPGTCTQERTRIRIRCAS